MSKLFVSHASEDKDAFVRPLVAELKKHFEVWFDEFELKLGDSLRTKIDAGLHDCDFGVVVLSPSFFSKKWTIAEVNGLFALEDSNRKIILPIWYQVGEKEVRDFSPILADRRAAVASKGIDRVVEDIRTAVEASERTHQVLSPDAGRRALNGMMQNLYSMELDDRVLQTEAGARLFRKSLDRIGDLVWSTVQSVNLPDRQRFNLNKSREHFQIQGPLRVCLNVIARNAAQNTVRDASVWVYFYLRASDFEDADEFQKMEEFFLRPTCAAEDRIAYREKPDSAVLSEEAFASHLVERLCLHITKRVKQQRVD